MSYTDEFCCANPGFYTTLLVTRNLKAEYKARNNMYYSILLIFDIQIFNIAHHSSNFMFTVFPSSVKEGPYI